MKQGRSTTQEERIQIAKECLESGKNYGEMALKYKVSYQQARTWTLRFEEFGEAGLEDRRGKRKKDQTPRTELERLQIENEQLKHKLYLAEMQRDLLKKLEEIERRYASQEGKPCPDEGDRYCRFSGCVGRYSGGSSEK